MRNKIILGTTAILIAASSIVFAGNKSTVASANCCPTTSKCVCCECTPTCQPGEPGCCCSSSCAN